jgi:hypothetical protein
LDAPFLGSRLLAAAGHYIVEFDMVEEQRAWFKDYVLWPTAKGISGKQPS